MFVQSTLLFLLQCLCSVILSVFASSRARAKPCYLSAGSQQASSSAASRGWVLPALLRQSLLVSLVMTWLDLVDFSWGLRSTCTIYPLQQQLQQLFLADRHQWAIPAQFRRGHLSTVLVTALSWWHKFVRLKMIFFRFCSTWTSPPTSVVHIRTWLHRL